MCGEGMFEWPRTEGPALALELLASEAAYSSLRSFDAIGGSRFVRACFLLRQ